LLGAIPVQPFDRRERRVVPARRVELRELVHRERRLVDGAAGELVALHARREIFEHQHELARGQVDLGGVARGNRHADRPRDVAVEAHLDLVGAERDAGRTTRGIARRELADHGPRGRAGGAVVRQR
jgi:hypothetical protein